MTRALCDFFCNARFELRAQLRRPTVYVATSLLFLYWLIFASRLRMEANFWGPSGGVFSNAPAVLYFTLSAQSFVTFLLIPIFLGVSPLRDRQAQVAESWLATPLRPVAALWGRFFAGFFVLASSTFVAGFGIVLSPYFRSAIGKASVIQIGPVAWPQLLLAWLILLVPTMFSASAFIFWLVVKTRRSSAAIAATTVFVLGAVISHYLGKSLHGDIFDVIDPTGIHAVHSIIAFWTVEQRNHSFLPLSDLLVMNRLLWLAFALAFSAWSSASFRRSRFLYGASRASKSRKLRHDQDLNDAEQAHLRHGPALGPGFVSVSRWEILLARLRVELSRLIREPLFNVVLLFFFLWLVAQHAGSLEIGLVRKQPTAGLLLKARGGLWMLVFYFLPFLTATSVFSERRLMGSEYLDALPIPNWLLWLPKLGALCIYSLLFPTLVVLASLLTHLVYSGQSFDLLSFVQVLGLSYYPFLLQLVLFAFAVSSLCRSRPMAYGLTMLLLYLGVFLYETASVPNEIALQLHEAEQTWSSFDRVAPYRDKILSKSLFWLLNALFAFTLATAYWKRGSLRRGEQGAWRWRGPLCLVLGALSVLVFRQTMRASTEWSRSQLRPQTESARAAYEKEFKGYREMSIPQPSEIDLRLEFMPRQRSFEYSWRAKLEKGAQEDIHEIFLQSGLNQEAEIFMSEEKVRPLRSFPEFGVHVLEFPNALAGQSGVSIRYDARHGFRGDPEHRDKPMGVVENGSYLGSSAMPRVGYDSAVELSLGLQRKKFQLGARPLESESARADCQWSGPAIGWKLHLVTTSSQYAVGPGQLEREWQEAGQNHFVYSSEHPDCSYFAFASARYMQFDSVIRLSSERKLRVRVLYNAAGESRAKEVLLAVEHALLSLREGLGEYPYTSLQVVQVRDDAALGVAPANTLFLKDSEGWLDRVEVPEDNHNLLFHTTHHLAQHWSHNLLAPARSPGIGIFNEAIPTYYANQVVEKRFSKPWFVKNYLTRAFRRYFRYHGINAAHERPVCDSRDIEQVASIKGSLALRELAREMGKGRLDATIRRFIRTHKGGPSPATADSFLASLELEGMEGSIFEEMFREIVHYDNRLDQAKASALPDGGYRLLLSLHARRLRKSPLADYPQESPWTRRLALEVSYEDGASTMHQIEVHNGVNAVELKLDARPVRARIDPEFRLLDFSLKDQAVMVETREEPVVLAR